MGAGMVLESVQAWEAGSDPAWEEVWQWSAET